MIWWKLWFWQVSPGGHLQQYLMNGDFGQFCCSRRKVNGDLFFSCLHRSTKADSTTVFSLPPYFKRSSFTKLTKVSQDQQLSLIDWAQVLPNNIVKRGFTTNNKFSNTIEYWEMSLYWFNFFGKALVYKPNFVQDVWCTAYCILCIFVIL